MITGKKPRFSDRQVLEKVLESRLDEESSRNVLNPKGYKKALKPFDFRTFYGPSDWIRTSGLLNPIAQLRKNMCKAMEKIDKNPQERQEGRIFIQLFIVP